MKKMRREMIWRQRRKGRREEEKVEGEKNKMCKGRS